MNANEFQLALQFVHRIFAEIIRKTYLCAFGMKFSFKKFAEIRLIKRLKGSFRFSRVHQKPNTAKYLTFRRLDQNFTDRLKRKNTDKSQLRVDCILHEQSIRNAVKYLCEIYVLRLGVVLIVLIDFSFFIIIYIIIF